MTDQGHNDENVLTQLKSQTATYIELPFNTGDFIVIAHYKLIAHYRQALNTSGNDSERRNPGKSPADDPSRRKELHEEVLFQLDKLLALTSLTEEQLEQLRLFKILHETILQELHHMIQNPTT